MNRTQHLTVQAQIALHAALHRVKPSDITGESKAQRCVIPRKHCFLALVCEVIGHKQTARRSIEACPRSPATSATATTPRSCMASARLQVSFTARRSMPRLPKSAKPFRLTWIAKGRQQHEHKINEQAPKSFRGKTNS
jgi:hypothetical protein